MFRSDRYFDKNERKNNFFGEEDYFDVKNGRIEDFDPLKDSPPKQDKHESSEEESG